jgi:hypothetical protein
MQGRKLEKVVRSLTPSVSAAWASELQLWPRCLLKEEHHRSRCRVIAALARALKPVRDCGDWLRSSASPAIPGFLAMNTSPDDVCVLVGQPLFLRTYEV